MRIASIDVGSNTVLLLIAEWEGNEIKFVKNEYRIPRLSKNLSLTGRISEESKTKFFSVLNEYMGIIAQFHCEKILCSATAAMRKAENSGEIIKEVKEIFGIEIEVIPGEREAEYSFLGATSTFPGKDNYAVLDIGGASTEIITGNPKKITYKQSFPFGAVTLTEEYLNEFPYKNNNLTELENFIKKSFETLPLNLKSRSFPIAVAGTPTSLVGIKLGLDDYIEEKVDGAFLTKDDLNKFINYFTKTSPLRLLEDNPVFLEGRSDVILAGTMLLKEFLLKSGSDMVNVSGRGLRYGMVIDYVNSLK